MIDLHMTIEQKIEAFFAAGPPFAVVGASTNRAKYGNKVLRCYLQNGHEAVAVNPRATEIEGVPCYSDVASLPDEVDCLSIITPPAVTETVVQQAIDTGIRHLWMQPGAESPAAIQSAEDAGLNVIADGSCLLVVLGYSESM